MVVDLEEIDNTASNSKDRIRRYIFYKKNDFKEGIYQFKWRGFLMSYMYTQDINPDEFIEHIKFMRPEVVDFYLK